MTNVILPQVHGYTYEDGQMWPMHRQVLATSSTPVFDFRPIPEYRVSSLKRWPLVIPELQTPIEHFIIDVETRGMSAISDNYVAYYTLTCLSGGPEIGLIDEGLKSLGYGANSTYGAGHHFQLVLDDIWPGTYWLTVERDEPFEVIGWLGFLDGGFEEINYFTVPEDYEYDEMATDHPKLYWPNCYPIPQTAWYPTAWEGVTVELFTHPCSTPGDYTQAPFPSGSPPGNGWTSEGEKEILRDHDDPVTTIDGIYPTGFAAWWDLEGEPNSYSWIWPTYNDVLHGSSFSSSKWIHFGADGISDSGMGGA